MRTESLLVLAMLAVPLVARTMYAQTAGDGRRGDLTLIPAPTVRPAPDAPKGCVCTADIRWITVRVLGPDGQPVDDATLRVRRVGKGSTSRPLRTVSEPVTRGSGEFVIAEDGALRLSRGERAVLETEVRWRGKRRIARTVVQLADVCGCHLERVGTHTIVRFD